MSGGRRSEGKRTEPGRTYHKRDGPYGRDGEGEKIGMSEHIR